MQQRRAKPLPAAAPCFQQRLSKGLRLLLLLLLLRLLLLLLGAAAVICSVEQLGRFP